MKYFLTIVFLLALSGTPVDAQKASPARPDAFRILSAYQPKVKWQPRTLIKGDFDYDGVADYALAGRHNGKFVVGIVRGTLTRRSKRWTLEFAEDSGAQNGLCSAAEARISLERFTGDEEITELRRLPAKSRGINLADQSCDSFHIYYSRREKQFTWWRN